MHIQYFKCNSEIHKRNIIFANLLEVLTIFLHTFLAVYFPHCSTNLSCYIKHLLCKNWGNLQYNCLFTIMYLSAKVKKVINIESWHTCRWISVHSSFTVVLNTIEYEIEGWWDSHSNRQTGLSVIICSRKVTVLSVCLRLLSLTLAISLHGVLNNNVCLFVWLFCP